jgi:hypothetical protein
MRGSLDTGEEGQAAGATGTAAARETGIMGVFRTPPSSLCHRRGYQKCGIMQRDVDRDGDMRRREERETGRDEGGRRRGRLSVLRCTRPGIQQRLDAHFHTSREMRRSCRRHRGAQTLGPRPSTLKSQTLNPRAGGARAGAGVAGAAGGGRRGRGAGTGAGQSSLMSLAVLSTKTGGG